MSGDVVEQQLPLPPEFAGGQMIEMGDGEVVG